MVIYPVEILQTAVSGKWSVNTVKFASAVLKQIVVEAASSTTTFGFTLTDEKNLTVYTTDTKATGKLREEVNIPLKGIYTMAVADASADNAFTGRLMVMEGRT